jgi:hypothetical protein|tara:strand:- start:29 stop:406 length:378 start_codon:yes stop_codon:yes gene_type:complete
MNDSIKKYSEMSKDSNLSAIEVLKKEYPLIYQTYRDIMDEQFELFAKKHLDYGMGNISAGTQLINEEEKHFAMTGLWYRLSDKINRWKNMILTGRKAQNETLIDTFQDITNYGIICQMVFKDKWK